MKKNVSQDYINTICELYNDIYDDRVENTCPPTAGSSPCIPGEDWAPGQCAEHKSLLAFQRELLENGISLSTSKIKKILITGGCWTTARSREIQELYFRYVSEGLKPEAAVACIAAELKISKVSVSVNLPYSSVVYKLEERSRNARRCERYRAKQKASREDVESQAAPCFAELLRQSDDKAVESLLWDRIAALQGSPFKTSGRNGSGGVEFTYSVKKDKSGSWCGELFVSTKEKSITRSTVMKAYRRAVELDGVVPGPKKLGTFGASYLYSIFQRLGVIKK